MKTFSRAVTIVCAIGVALGLAGCASKSDFDSESHFLCRNDSDCAWTVGRPYCVERTCVTPDQRPSGGTGGSPGAEDSGTSKGVTGGHSGVADGSSGGSMFLSPRSDTGTATNRLMCNCPPDAYFVEVNGDGDPIVLTFEGLQTSKWCPDGANSNVARGNATVNCGASGAEFSACANSDHGPPCLDMGAVAGTYGTYVDRSGRSWSVTAYDFHLVEPADALTGSFEGNYTAMVSADGGLPVAISGNVHVCGWVSHPLTPCH